MKNEDQQLEALHDIRKMMKESSRFLSLSGLSGIFAGVFALAGAYLVQLAIHNYYSAYSGDSSSVSASYTTLIVTIIIISCVVLLLSAAIALYLSNKKARKNNHKLLDHSSKRLLWSMIIPFVTGGIFCVSLVAQGNGYLLLISPAMLIFYGLSLVSGSHLTLNEVKYLGYLEIALGLTACFYRDHGLLFWSLGFGVLHIIYGSIMWFKYDRNQ